MRVHLLHAVAIVALLVTLSMSALAADFPRWRGANSNGSAGETAMPLAMSWDDVRVAWASEALSPHPWNYSVVRGRTQWPRTVLTNGGLCEPTIWDGKVYVSIYRPSGTETKPEDADKWQASGLPGYTLLHADAVIVCMDAKTGRTLWEAVWKETEANLIELYGGHNNLCIADGRVYAIGNTGLLYCADATTGEKLWVSPVGPSHKAWAKYNGQALEVLFNTPPPTEPPHPLGGSLNINTYNMCPVVADGVVVTGEWSAGSGLAGFDAKTGKELWRQPRVGGGVVPPIRWVHDGKEYLVQADSTLTCLEPKTGKILWAGGQIANTGYDAATAAIEGDLLVAHGAWASQRKGKNGAKVLPIDQQEGWICYKLSPTGATKAWTLDGGYPGASYIAPVVHRGYGWLFFNPKANGAEDVKGGMSLACVEMATGAVVSVTPNLPVNSTCPGPVAMGDLLVYQSGEFVWLLNIADPKAPKFLGTKAQPSSICCSATAADGFVYFRSAERLVACLDVRKPETRVPATTHDDPATARYELTLEGALNDDTSPTLLLCSKNGAFPQTWALVPSDPKHPDVVEPGTLKVKDGVLDGQMKLLTANTFYDYKLRATVKDGKVEGEYEDCYRGVPLKNTVNGTMLAPAGKNCRIKLNWSRDWFNGSGQVHEHNMFVTVTDGKVTTLELIPRRGTALRNQSFNPTVEKHDLQFDGAKLTGTVTLDMKCSGATPGHYVWTFDVTPDNNLMRGTVGIARDGVQTGTFECWGDAAVPDTEPAVPANAIYWIDLTESVRFDNATTGSVDTRVYATVKDGKGVSGRATVRGTGGLHRTDVSALRVEGNRLKGRIEVWMKGDGYLIRTEAHNVYDIDVEIRDAMIGGNYTGTFDVREPKRGAITGTYVNER